MSRELAKSAFTALSPVAFNNERGAESDYLRSPRIIADDGEFRFFADTSRSFRPYRAPPEVGQEEPS